MKTTTVRLLPELDKELTRYAKENDFMNTLLFAILRE